METAIYKSSVEAIQDGSLDISSKAEDVIPDNMFFHQTISMKKSEEMDLNLNPKVHYSVSDKISENSEENLCNGNIDSTTDPASEKTMSPTLIENAFKVVKNFFSPDKSRSKSSSVINQKKSSSGSSPQSGIDIPSKSDLHNLHEIELDSDFRSSTPTDTILKGENFCTNQPGLLPMYLNHEPHNNTDDSFLTTVSLVDESFQSAVTHLDENLKNDNVDHENLFGDSRNFDVVDISSNDTINSSELGLDNTMLKNSLIQSTESKSQDLSDNSSNVLMDAVTPRTEEIETDDTSEEKLSLNSQKRYDDLSINETLSEESVETNFQQPLQSEDVKEILKENLLSESETDSLNSVSSSSREVKFVAGDSASKSCYLKLGENGEENLQNITESVNKIASEEDSQQKLIDSKSYIVDDSGKNLDNLESKVELIDDINENDFPRSEEKVVFITDVNAKDYPLQLNFTKSNNDICQNEKEIEIESSISTTTVVLSESDSILDVHDSLKENLFEPQVATIKETDPIPVIVPAPNDLTSPKSKKTLIQIDNNKQQKRLIKSETNTPNKISNPNRNKLNKSADFTASKNYGKSPRRRKNTGHKKEPSPFREIEIGNQKLNSLPVKSNTCNNAEGTCKNELNNSPKKVEDVPTIASQQSYTVLDTVDKNLQRPVIPSSENLSNDLFKSKSEEWNHNTSKDNETEKLNVGNVVVSEQSDTSAENISKINTPKTSTPICGNSGTAKKRGQSESKILTSKVLDLTMNEEERYSDAESTEPPNATREKSQASESRKPPEISFGENGVRAEISPVLPEGHRQFVLPDSSEQEKSSPNGVELNSTWVKPGKILNSTYDKKSESAGGHQLNQTFNKAQGLEEVKPSKNEGAVASPKVKNLNQTFDVKTEPAEGVMNQTYDKNPCKLNKTYDKKPELLNQTFDVPNEPTNKFNQTFEKKSSAPANLNQTFSKKVDKIGEPAVSDEKLHEVPAPSSNKTCTEGVVGAKACPTTIVDKSFLKSELPVIFDEVKGDNKEALNASFSTNSSNASLFLNSNATMVLNQGNIIDDLSNTSRETLQSINLKKDEEKESPKPTTPDDFQIQNHSIFVNKQLPTSPKYDKVHCDLELVQLIQEQFSSTDIEKICSVVDDMSMKKLSSEIQKANEQFVKSFHQDIVPNGGFETPEDDFFPEKFTGSLTPQSFEFLSSIRGKPTGRDLSRESLYVKFDPLVQAPNSNSLIDFTKEVDPFFSGLESVPENAVAGENDKCSHLLTISPEKKPDDIVPPLTPLSQRDKKNLRDDEKLKDLQNEIYFLKNLYAERERNQKAKMEEYESQITKLTGQNCILEDRIKGSNEREKSLAKKVKEQNHNLDNLKVVMEEYSKVITKLTSELEQLRKENKSQVDTLVSEKDSYMMHLQNTEAAFSDVHAKYEKSKKTIMNLKSNETMFRNTIAEQTQKLEEYKERSKALQENACKEFQKMQEELAETKANHGQETARLRALLRKTELKLEAIQESLDQKIKENEQLTAICDELIEGKK